MQKNKRISRKYSPELKISVIMDLRKNHLSYREAAEKYCIAHHTRVVSWERKYLEEGEAGLMKDGRGRPSATGKKVDRPVKLEKSVEEDLIAENQRLRMEIEYLKKLSALVLAEERENANKR